jgi:hypothetical protein
MTYCGSWVSIDMVSIQGLPWCRGDLDQRHAARTDTGAKRELSSVIGADVATIARWQAFWRDHIPHTPFRKVARAPHKEHGNAPIGDEPEPVQRKLLERLGPRCPIVRAEPQRGSGSTRGRPFPVPHRV